MLVFVTAVKHPHNSQSYDEVWRLLNNTLFSVCSQQNADFRVVVVCDKQLPLFHHVDLINRHTEFIQVDFPSHGQVVIDDFNRLGNLSIPVEDPSFWDPGWWHNAAKNKVNAKKRMTRNRIFKRARRLLFGQKTQHAAAVQKQHYMSAPESLLMANYALNRGSKQLLGILTAKKYNPDYVLMFDADDYVGCDIAAYVNTHPGENGWLMTHGYKMMDHLITPLYNKTTFCGTGNIVSYALLEDDIPADVSETSTQNELFEKIDSKFLITLARHGKMKAFYEKKGRPLLDYPFRSVVHLLGHEESNEHIRRSIKGESETVRLKAAQKYSRFSPISSRLVDYFSIMPRNETKVFCLGFHKTGTTSMEWLLQDMGYQVATYYKNWDAAFCNAIGSGDLTEVKQVSELFDAFQDAPWFLYYREFDQWYPGSKFILTVRDSRSWWASFLYYFEKRSLPIFQLIYGVDNPVGHEKTFVARYEQHNRDVMAYFKDRADDLLVVDVSEDDALRKTERFLGKHSSYSRMPHKNASRLDLQDGPGHTPKSLLERLNKKSKKTRYAQVLKIVFFSTPIIIGGCRESGAELMLSILSCHPHIHAAGDFKSHLSVRHPLSRDRRLIKPGPANAKNTSPVGWYALIKMLLKQPVADSARRWCGTNPFFILMYDRLLANYGKNVRILNMVRDGRDVVTENGQTVMQSYAVPCDRWVHDVKEGMKFEDHPQVLTVRYEDLIFDYETTMKRVGEFISEQDITPFLNHPTNAKIIADQYWVGKWQAPRFSGRIEELQQTPGALECLRHYGYVE